MMWEALAERFQQLYLTPGAEGMAEYREIVRKGKDAKTRDLSHFIRHPEDSLTQENTPAGAVDVACIHERADFERFLQIMANKCEPVGIPATQGAAILDGLIDWPKIRAYRSAYFAETLSRGDVPDWPAAFARFREDKRNYTSALIVLSWGPYSGLDAAHAGLSDAEWLEASHTIRKHHECTHFLCRRRYPGKIDAIWDELTADAVGLLAAFGEYPAELALRLLGISQGRYIGGRLENYVSGDCTPEAWLPYCQGLVAEISDMVPMYEGRDAYHLALALEERKEDIEASIAPKPVTEKGARK